MAVYLAVSGDVFDGVLFCAVLFQSDVLYKIWDQTESVPENFSTYFWVSNAFHKHKYISHSHI